MGRQHDSLTLLVEYSYDKLPDEIYVDIFVFSAQQYYISIIQQILFFLFMNLRIDCEIMSAQTILVGYMQSF